MAGAFCASKVHAKLSELIRLLVPQAKASDLGRNYLVFANPPPVALS
jgi:hypothetical protein